jgi:hypothetical protein
MWIVPLLLLASQEAPIPGSTVIRGSVVIRDEAGLSFEGTHGALMLNVGGALPREWLVPFRDGAFELRLDQRVYWVDAYAAWTAFGPARIDDINQTVADGYEFELLADVVAPFTLKVLDAETEQVLECVDVIPPRCGEGVRRAFSGLDGAAIEIGPFRGDALFERRGDGAWIVHAPGYVEGRVLLLPDSPASNVVYLERAGSVELNLVNAPSTRHTFVELDSAEIEHFYRAHPDPRRPLRIEGLKPGPCVARVVHEFLDFRRVVLAEARIEVVAGGVASVRLSAAPSPEDDTDGPWEPIDVWIERHARR